MTLQSVCDGEQAKNTDGDKHKMRCLGICAGSATFDPASFKLSKDGNTSQAVTINAKQCPAIKVTVKRTTLRVPQTRDGGFYPTCLERGIRSERALKLAIAEMYFQGVSTRKVQSIMREL